MNELIAVISGVLTFIVGQIVIRFVLEPWQEQKRVIGKIIHAQIFYDNALPSLLDAESKEQQETITNAKKEFRQLSGELLAVTNTIPFYPKAKAIEAAKLLLDVSEKLGSAHNATQMDSLSRKRFRALELLKVKYWHPDQ